MSKLALMHQIEHTLDDFAQSIRAAERLTTSPDPAYASKFTEALDRVTTTRRRLNNLIKEIAK